MEFEYKIEILVLLLIHLHLWNGVLGFNMDTDHPVIYKGPNNSYFGYTTAILRNSEGTW